MLTIHTKGIHKFIAMVQLKNIYISYRPPSAQTDLNVYNNMLAGALNSGNFH